MDIKANEITTLIKEQIKKYQKLNIDPTNNVRKQYMVLDVANPNNNLTDYVTDVNVQEFRKLKKALSRVIDTKTTESSSAAVVLDINPILNSDTSEYKWSYKIEGTHYHNNGGSYDNTSDGILTAMYKGLYKGLRAVVDNNLNRKNIEVHSNKGNIFAMMKMIAGCLFAAFMCMFVSLATSGDTIMAPLDSFKYSMENRFGGGIIGGCLAYFISRAFDVAGGLEYRQ